MNAILLVILKLILASIIRNSRNSVIILTADCFNAIGELSIPMIISP